MNIINLILIVLIVCTTPFLAWMAFKKIFYLDVTVHHLSADGKARTQRDYARKTKLKGIEVVKLFKNKIYAEIPSDKSTNYTLKGRQEAILFKHPKGNVNWATINYPEKELYPLTYNQRAMRLAEHQKAMDKLITNRWPEIIVPATAFLVIGAVIFMFFIFWKDIYQVSAQSTEVIDSMLKTNKELVQEVRLIKQYDYAEEKGIQIIGDPSPGDVNGT